MLSLTSDCGKCASLCCVVFAFDKSESFAFDKSAGEPCRHLSGAGQCDVFAARKELGFSGCITYDCHGAGQRVTQEIFGGRHWRDHPELVERMGEALSVLRRVHENLLLLKTAGSLALSKLEAQHLTALQGELIPSEGWSESSLQDFPIESVSQKVATFLQGLRRHIDASFNARN